MVALTYHDYEAIAAQMGLPVKTIQSGLENKKNIASLYLWFVFVFGFEY